MNITKKGAEIKVETRKNLHFAEIVEVLKIKQKRRSFNSEYFKERER
ncbi:hypothetical protein B4099_2199 [Heyndrickxia coagulans]|uniref:Uncharacterized protein n=1 Tax=Heyndrickxia coagulans TaxID=1398 RepID=A0A150JWR6_HEYCO|nr:hypothetical protein B4099_2199 [Heyndrickxia coagulans]